MKPSTLALGALLFAIGCGRVVSVDDSTDAPITEKDAAVDDVTQKPDVSTDDVVTTQPEAGACAAFTPPDGTHIGGGGGMACQVVVGVHDDHGSPANDFATSAVGSATLTGKRLRLTCGEPGNLIMIATIDCYQGPGKYEVPAGALILGGKVSDRKCRLDADTTEGELRGFIGCDKDPVEPANLFSNTVAPIGLGAYALPYP